MGQFIAHVFGHNVCVGVYTVHACVAVMVGTHHSSAALFDCPVTTATLLLVNSGGLEGGVEGCWFCFFRFTRL